MSWFSEFSEKAENVLNAIDKNAALVLNNQNVRYNKQIQTFPESTNISTEFSLPSSSDEFKFNSSINNSSSSSEPINVSDYQPNVSSSIKGKYPEYLQNEMLQNEIHSLNNEISLLLTRVKIAEQKKIDLSEKLSKEENKNSLLQEQISKLILKKSNADEIVTIYPNFSKSRANGDEKADNFHEYSSRQIQKLLQDKSVLNETLRKKEDEIILLKSRLSQKTYCFSADELQSRLRALTITLVQKQSSLDSLTSEKNTLTLKLSQLQERYDEVVGYLHQLRINTNDTDDVKAHAPSYNCDKGLLHHLNKIYSPITTLGMNAEIFFKKRSVIRIFFILYIILTHFLIFSLIYLHMPVSTDV